MWLEKEAIEEEEVWVLALAQEREGEEEVSRRSQLRSKQLQPFQLLSPPFPSQLSSFVLG